jgi:REP element-mobilizing transposase RayT
MTVLLESGRIFHIYNRGNNKEVLFRNEEDCEHFLHLYSVYVNPIADNLAWCLMKNHFHFCVRIKENENIGFIDTRNASLKKPEDKWAIVKETTANKEFLRKPNPKTQWQLLFNSYAMWFNRKYSRTGSLFEKNYERKLVANERYLKDLIIYINLNPVKHKVVKKILNYRWSSYHEVFNKSFGICNTNLLWQYFDDKENFDYLHSFEKYDLDELY